MCGRYGRNGDKQNVATWFEVSGDLSDLPPLPDDYNIAPTSFQPIVRQAKDTDARELVLVRWGLVPFFAKDLNAVKGISTINARAESIATTATWREPVKKRRCLVPASVFYEWPKTAKAPRQPYAFALPGADWFAFAGVWDAWRDPNGHWLQSYAIVTTEANELMRPIHPRMPVILDPRDYDRWLDRGEVQRLPLDLLAPFDPSAMKMWEANPKVNNVRNNGPEVLRAGGPSAAEDGNGLFQ
jgi:putative SOS response-associated peptidase YedK